MNPLLWRRAAQLAAPILVVMTSRLLWRALHDRQPISAADVLIALAAPVVIGLATVLIARMIAPKGSYEALLDEREKR